MCLILSTNTILCCMFPQLSIALIIDKEEVHKLLILLQYSLIIDNLFEIEVGSIEFSYTCSDNEKRFITNLIKKNKNCKFLLSILSKMKSAEKLAAFKLQTTNLHKLKQPRNCNNYNKCFFFLPSVIRKGFTSFKNACLQKLYMILKTYMIC